MGNQLYNSYFINVINFDTIPQFTLDLIQNFISNLKEYVQKQLVLF